MRRLLLAVVLSVVLVGAGAAPAAASPRVAAAGTFTVAVTGPPALQPLPGGGCLATLPVTLGFEGTLTGAAPGTIRVAVGEPCGVAFAAPPGTFADVFLFTGTFSGTVAGEETTARLVYSGLTRSGGQVRGLMALFGNAHGLLRVEAMAGAGGSYSGVVKR